MNMLLNPLGSNSFGHRGNAMPNYYPTRIINIVCRGCAAKKGETCRKKDGNFARKPCPERYEDSRETKVEQGQQSARECAKAKKLLDDALSALQRALTIESIPTEHHDAISDVQALLMAAKQDLVYLSVGSLPEVPKAAPLLRPEARAAVEADNAQDDVSERACQGAGLVSSDPTEAERFQIDVSGPLKFSEGDGAGELHRLPNAVQTWEQGSGSATLIGPVTISGGTPTQFFPVDGIPGMARKPIIGTWVHYVSLNEDGIYGCTPACVMSSPVRGEGEREYYEARLFILEDGGWKLTRKRIVREEVSDLADLPKGAGFALNTWHFSCPWVDTSDVDALKAALT